MADHPQALAQLLDRARRRHVLQLVFEQSALATAAALAGAVVLLLIGTQILEWYWLAVLFGGAFAYGFWRTWKQVPSRYELAQRLDRQLNLHDSLSTAYDFAFNGRATRAQQFRDAQLSEAESLARTTDPARAFPFAVPRSMYAAGGVALVAFGMFAIRYGVTHSLDLKPSLVNLAFDNFFKPRDVADAKKSGWRKKIEDELKKLGINVATPDSAQNGLDRAPDSALDVIDTPDVNSPGESESQKTQTSSVQSERESGEQGGEQQTERASSSDEQKGNEQPAEGDDGNPQNGNQPAQAKNAKQSNGDNSNLMDKMKDAMSSLLDKLKMNPKQGEGKQSAQNNQGKSQQGKSDKGQNSGKQQSNGSDARDAQAQQQGDQSQSAQGKSGEKNGEKQSAQDSKSGIGKQDGDKSAREAEQLAAMGKISEILGKRAKDMQGEMMVEVAGGKQQLKTQYSSKNGAHAEAGGEISRDEVPIEYREYVQHYFENIRKMPAAKAKGAEAVSPAPTTTGKKTE